MELPEREQPHGDLEANLSLHDWMSLSLSDRLRLVSRDMSLSAVTTPAPEAAMSDRVETLTYEEQVRFALELSKKEAAEKEASREQDAAAALEPPPNAPVTVNNEYEDEDDDELSQAIARSLLPDEQASEEIRELMVATDLSLMTELQNKRSRPFGVLPSPVPVPRSEVVNRVTVQSNSTEQPVGATAKPPPDDQSEDALIELAIKMSLQVSTTKEAKPKKGDPRPVIIDGNNVAFHHGNHEKFSAEGLLNCFNYFNDLGHEKVVIFATDGRKIVGPDREICDRLNKANILHWVQSGRTYDDLTLLDYAKKVDGIVVSNDKFRDVQRDYPEYENFIKKRVTTYTFVLGDFMLPPDPLGRGGPKREHFLRF